jgi:hypothetical protein
MLLAGLVWLAAIAVRALDFFRRREPACMGFHMAQRYPEALNQCPLLGVKRTFDLGFRCTARSIALTDKIHTLHSL